MKYLNDNLNQNFDELIRILMLFFYPIKYQPDFAGRNWSGPPQVPIIFLIINQQFNCQDLFVLKKEFSQKMTCNRK